MTLDPHGRRSDVVADAGLPLRLDRAVDRGMTAGFVHRGLRAKGLDVVEAGNLTAFLFGMPCVAEGWSLAEIERLLFARYLAGHGRLRS
jgi:hypothetical protein